MVEKITITPKIRGWGNILNPRSIEDYTNYNSILIDETIDVEDVPYNSAFKQQGISLFSPSLDGTDEIVSWTQGTNKTENGVFTSHGSYLANGWDNTGLWKLEFDVAYTDTRYIGLLICPLGIEPYTDSEICATTWEGGSTPVWRGSTLTSGPSTYKYSNPTQYHHYIVTKTSPTTLKIEFEDTTWIYQCNTLPDYSRLSIGSRDNPSSRNTGGNLLLKNIIVDSVVI